MWGILLITITLTNKDNDYKNNYKKIVEELAKERFDEIKELIHEINQNDLIYHFKGNTSRKRFVDLNSGIELFQNLLKWNYKKKNAA